MEYRGLIVSVLVSQGYDIRCVSMCLCVCVSVRPSIYMHIIGQVNVEVEEGTLTNPNARAYVSM